MLLINFKTGKAEPMENDCGDDIVSPQPERPADSSFLKKSAQLGYTPKGNSSFGRKKPTRNEDDFVSEITRTSDYAKKRPLKNASSSFSKKIQSNEPGVITRTSDKKQLYKAAPNRVNPEKPAHSSRSYAVWLLSRRDYSAAVLRNKLILRGYDATEADEAMTFVIKEGYQNDARYAEHLMQALSRRSGDRRLIMTLKQRKVDPGVLVLPFDQLDPEAERAAKVAEKFKKNVLEDGMTQKLQQKIYRFLAYRGFSSASIKAAMQSLSDISLD